MEIGDVFRWNSYPFAIDGGAKPRWFLYLGTYREDPFSQIMLIIPTSTTQIHHFERGGKRSSHSHIFISAGDGFGFDRDCVLDFEEVFYDTPLEELKARERDIEMMGAIKSVSALQKIYSAICAARDVDRFIKIQVRDNLRSIGVPV